MSKDEEYQLPSRETAGQPKGGYQGATATAKQAASVKPKKKGGFLQRNQRLVIIGMVAILVLIAFRLFNPPPTPTVVEEEPVAEVKSVPQPQTIQPVKADKIDYIVNDEVGSLRTELRADKDTLSTLQDRMVAVEDDLDKIKNQEAEIIQALSAMMEQIDQVVARQKAVSTKIRRERVNYYLKAAVPGRAWLIDDKGRVETVTVGNKLNFYGEIKAIDDERGIVFTSSGEKIEPGPRDR